MGNRKEKRQFYIHSKTKIFFSFDEFSKIKCVVFTKHHDDIHKMVKILNVGGAEPLRY